MKIVFEFDSENEDDMHKYDLYNNAVQMIVALDKIDNLTRNWYKYGDKSEISTETVRDEINSIIMEYVPNFDKL